ncbi:MAG: gamma carbonic anhydrase family protein [Bacteroidia bacterium]
MIKTFQNIAPSIAEGVFIAENATVIGRVVIGAQSSIWYNTVLRGDVDEIRIGERTNIQDSAILHCSTHRSPVVIGNDVTVGHGAMIHGCTIEDEVLIGMGAIILDEAYIPKQCVVAAGALVTERSVLESGWLYAGIPAKKIKPLTDEQIAGLKLNALHYVENAEEHKHCQDIH